MRDGEDLEVGRTSYIWRLSGGTHRPGPTRQISSGFRATSTFLCRARVLTTPVPASWLGARRWRRETDVPERFGGCSRTGPLVGLNVTSASATVPAAEADPPDAVVSTVAAGCGAVRVAAMFW
jgi:hypothetical protein